MIKEAKARNDKADSLRRIADALEKIANKPVQPTNYPMINPSNPYVTSGPAYPMGPYVGDVPLGWWQNPITSWPNTSSQSNSIITPASVTVSMVVS